MRLTISGPQSVISSPQHVLFDFTTADLQRLFPALDPLPQDLPRNTADALALRILGQIIYRTRAIDPRQQAHREVPQAARLQLRHGPVCDLAGVAFPETSRQSEVVVTPRGQPD